MIWISLVVLYEKYILKGPLQKLIIKEKLLLFFFHFFLLSNNFGIQAILEANMVKTFETSEFSLEISYVSPDQKF